MFKNKAPLIFVALFLSFFINNVSFALQDATLNERYPDYACEFCGKDKFEGFNRKLFVFNLKLNKYVLRPVNVVWASVMPKYGMDRLKNAYNNMNFPVRVVSCLLQKDFEASKQETLRFLTNTTIGFGGLYDPAKNKFKLEPREEDMGQVLAHCKVKQGPYLVLPVVRGSVRDLFGQLLNCPLRPFSYIPIAGGIANAFLSMNNVTYIQPIIKKVEESYADPYQIVKQIDGIREYIENTNLDRENFLKEENYTQNTFEVSSMPVNSNLKADIKFENYNPQTPLLDSMRTALFEGKNPNKSIWADVSVWNRSFNKKIKISSLNIDKNHPNYKYRYILQKNKNSPLAIIYPSIGEGIHSDHSDTLSRILYDNGYSVIIQGSSFQWEFVKSMPDGYSPGLPNEDASYVRQITAQIIEKIENKKGYKFGQKIIVGSSFGALTNLFVASQEELNNTLGVSKYISISPPVDLFFALRKLDKYCEEWKNDPVDIKIKAAITAEKTLQMAQKVCESKDCKSCERFPFNEDEAKLIVGFIMKQKLSDVVFAIEKGCTSKKCTIYDSVNKMSFYNYGQKYLFVNQEKTPEQFEYDSSLYSLGNFLKENKKYKIYHSLDDYFVNQDQLAWLKNQTGNQTTLVSNGSHLGFLYREEFLDDFKKEISFETVEQDLQQLNVPEESEPKEELVLQPGL